jgi:hypothetical protein
VDVWLGSALDRWNGRVSFTAEALRSNGVLAAQPVGRVDFDGSQAGTAGRARIGAKAISGVGA